MPRPPTRELLYRRLVRCRKADTTLSKYGFTNPSATPYDGKHVGSYAHWAGNLYADVMVVYPDFRSVEKFIADKGRPVVRANPDDSARQSKLRSNGFLLKLLRSSEWDIGLPDAPLEASVFIADAVPFCGLGDTYTAAKKIAYRHCATNYVIPLIELIKPRVVIAVGVGVTNALFHHLAPIPDICLPHIVSKAHICRMLSAPHRICNEQTMLFPVYHPGYKGQLKRSIHDTATGFDAMLVDWQKISNVLVNGS